MTRLTPAGSDSDWYKPKIPPILLWISTILWELVDVISNIDFLMSFRSDILFKMFELFADYGWALLVLGSMVWFFSVYKKTRKKVISPALVIVVGVLAFMWGVLLTVYAVGSTPKVISHYGMGSKEGCTATFNTSRLTRFSKNYDIALVCGVKDSSRDKFADTRITISSPFSIQPTSFEISAEFGGEIMSYIKTLNKLSVWHVAVLLKKGTDIKVIHSLNDVAKYDGKILDQP